MSGTITFTAPATHYDETPATGSLTAVVSYMSSENPNPTEIARRNVQCGDAVSMDITMPSAGLYDFSIVVSNEEGPAPAAVLRGIFVGNDTPMPAKPVLTYENNVMSLIWDPVDEAVNGATMLISEAMTDPAVADELKSEQGENGINAISKEVLLEFIGIVAGSVFLVALALFCYDLVFTTRRRPDYYDKAELWRERRKTYLILGIVSLGTGLIFWLLASWIYNIWRTKRRKCPTCGHKMQRLPEDKDNELLNPSQDFEERLNTVDYDVWECPHCGTIERFPFITKQTKYTECPACHTIAMCLKCDTVLQQPTTRRAGAGVRLYECQFCHHQHREGYTIPKKEDMSGAAAILGASILSGGSGGSGGGGGFGGFGGGATGGGGASGSW